MVPGDTRSPMVTSGVRLGTPALTTRGMKQKEMNIIGEWIATALKNPQDMNVQNRLKNQVQELCQQFPLFQFN